MSEPIHALVFTKERAMQLDAFLESAERYAPYASVTVLSATEDDAYELCIRRHMQYAKPWRFDCDDGFEQPVRDFLVSHSRVVFHTDDDVFFAAPPREPLLGVGGVVLTFRQGRNTTYCHPLGTAQAVPDVFPWKWREAEHDFAYPLSLNACVYDSRWILPLLDFSFSNPTELEAQLAANAARFEIEWMTAPEHSCVVSLPHNVVSESSGNPHGQVRSWQPAELREAYLAGARIDLGRLAYELVDAAHVELPLYFTRA